jgi:Na+-translocating ferredoxin:NAD+ oxidoreductase RnfC subunit
MSLVEKVRLAGVVGAGGGGFPTHVKLAAKADTVIANGAECEPLLHKDAVIMERQAQNLVRGMQLVMEAVGARSGVIGIKAKKKHAVEHVQAACQNTPVRVQLLGDYYPAGDEYDLVHSVTGRLIPPGGIPIQVGVVVANVETLVNVAAAAEDRPVTHKMLTINGAVHKPVTLVAPLGISFRDLLVYAGGTTTPDPVLCIGGLMMGLTTDQLDLPVTKTTTGVIVLPREHSLIQRKLKPVVAQARIGKSACDQCRYCTELCPRYLLGYAVEPHAVMRSLAFSRTGDDYYNSLANLCCACGLCTLFSCPEQLFPKEACDASKAVMRQKNFKPPTFPAPRVHAMIDGRRTPIKALARRLGVLDYDLPAPYSTVSVQPRKVTLPLKQGAGVPIQPGIKIGDTVAEGQPLGDIPAKSLGAILHAPMAGRVMSITDAIVLEKIP